MKVILPTTSIIEVCNVNIKNINKRYTRIETAVINKEIFNNKVNKFRMM